MIGLMNFSKQVRLLVLTLAVAVSSQSHAAEYLVKYKSEKAVNSIIAMQTESAGLEVRSMHKPGRLLKINVSEKNKNCHYFFISYLFN